MDIAINTIGGKARPPSPERAVRTLARRRPVALLAGRRRHRDARGRADAVAHGSGGQQLPLVGGSARPPRPRRRDDGDPARRPLPVGRREPAERRRRRPGRDGARAGAAAGSPPRLRVVSRRRVHARRTRRVGGDALGRDRGRRAAGRERNRAGAGAQPLRHVGRDVERVRRDAIRPSQSATPRTGSSSGARPSIRISTGRSVCSPRACARCASPPTTRPRPTPRRPPPATASARPRSPRAGATGRTRRCTTPTRAMSRETSH